MFVYIGVNGVNEEGVYESIPCGILTDYKYLKIVTKNHKVVTCHNTYKEFYSLLPESDHIVIGLSGSNNVDNIECFETLDDFLNKYNESDKCIFILGIIDIYNQLIDKCDILMLTRLYSNSDMIDRHIEYGGFKMSNESHMFKSPLGYMFRRLIYHRLDMPITEFV